jgi:glycosyltransferase involved in cell wall biosynthesis
VYETLNFSRKHGSSRRAIVVLFYNLAMARLAWFTPLPPSHSGIATYSVEVLPLVARRHQIDTFVDPDAPRPTLDAGLPVFPSRDFIWRHNNQPYDLVIYQLGNATCHDYMWPYLVRFPGLVVLHDGQLHQARSKALLTSRRPDDYRAEFAFCHPDANPGIAEIVIAALGGSLYFLWPLLRVPIESSRLVASHSPWLAAHLRERYPTQEFYVIEMGVADPCQSEVRSPRSEVENQFPDSRLNARARHGIGADRLVFAAYGMLTPEKRLREIFKGLRSVLPYAPDAHLLLVGQPVDYYDVEADARAIGVADRVTVTGYVKDEDLPAYLTAPDVCLCLRWPTSRETSASWLRCLAAGKPTVITDLIHTSSVPALDPRRWTTLDPYDPTSAIGLRPSDSGRRTPDVGPRPTGAADIRTLGPSDLRTTARSEIAPVCVAIDIVDEQHSLGLAMRRLARDEHLRRELGCRAREYWTRHHTPERMANDYQQAIEAALGRPAPDRSHLPAHLLADGTGLTKEIVSEFGLSLETLGW